MKKKPSLLLDFFDKLSPKGIFLSGFVILPYLTTLCLHIPVLPHS